MSNVAANRMVFKPTVILDSFFIVFYFYCTNFINDTSYLSTTLKLSSDLYGPFTAQHRIGLPQAYLVPTSPMPRSTHKGWKDLHQLVVIFR